MGRPRRCAARGTAGLLTVHRQEQDGRRDRQRDSTVQPETTAGLTDARGQLSPRPAPSSAVQFRTPSSSGAALDAEHPRPRVDTRVPLAARTRLRGAVSTSPAPCPSCTVFPPKTPPPSAAAQVWRPERRGPLPEPAPRQAPRAEPSDFPQPTRRLGRRCPLCPTACVPPGPAAASKTSFLDAAAADRWGLAGGRGVLPSRQRACRADLQKRRSPHPRAAAQLPECAGRQALDARHSHSAISDTGNKTFLDHPKTTRVSPKYHETCLRNYATTHQRFLENANRELYVTILSADTPRALHRDPAQTRRESPSPQVTSPPLEASGKQTLWTCLGARGTRSRQGT